MAEASPEPARQPAPGVSSPALWAGVVAFAVGLAAFRQLPFLLPPWFLSLPLLLAVVALYRFPGRAAALAAALLAGFWWQGLTGIEQQAHPFPAAWERQTVRVAGWIAGPVSDRGRRQRFRFRVERLRGPEGEWRAYGGTLRLSWYRPVPEALAYGQGGSTMPVTCAPGTWPGPATFAPSPPRRACPGWPAPPCGGAWRPCGAGCRRRWPAPAGTARLCFGPLRWASGIGSTPGHGRPCAERGRPTWWPSAACT